MYSEVRTGQDATECGRGDLHFDSAMDHFVSLMKSIDLSQDIIW